MSRRRYRAARGATLLASGDPVATWQRLALDFRQPRVLNLIASGPVFDASAPDELKERVARWMATTQAGKPS